MARAARWRIDRPGSRAPMRLVEEPLPAPAPGEVTVEVAAVGVNYADGIVRLGLYASARRLHGYPITPGFECAGSITAVGDGVEDLAVGQRVMVLRLFGAYASAMNVPVRHCFPIPEGIGLPEAAGIPTVFLTAWYLTHRLLAVESGESWLVHSAAGGVGQALLQYATRLGCRAVGVVGAPHKRAAAQAAGATAVIDKSREDLWARARELAPEGYQAVFDANGVSTLAGSYAHLASGGRLVVYGFASMLPREGRLDWLRLLWAWLRTPRFSPLSLTEHNRSVVAGNLSFLSAQAELLRRGMTEIVAELRAGGLSPLPVTVLPFTEAPEAIDRLMSGQTTGKLVLAVA